VPPFSAANPSRGKSSTLHAPPPELLLEDELEEPEPDELEDELLELDEPDELEDELFELDELDDELLDVVEELVELPPEDEPPPESPPPPHPVNKMAITASAVSLHEYICLSGRYT
jgi:hypothetical protein